MDAMIALYPPTSVATALAVPGGEPSDKLHITLAYFPELTQLEWMTLLRVVGEFSVDVSKEDFNGTINGIGEFMNEDENVLLALPDMPSLFNVRARLLRRLGEYELKSKVAHNHGYIPHITLQYVSEPTNVPVSLYKKVDLWFDSIFVVSDNVGFEFPIR